MACRRFFFSTLKQIIFTKKLYPPLSHNVVFSSPSIILPSKPFYDWGRRSLTDIADLALQKDILFVKKICEMGVANEYFNAWNKTERWSMITLLFETWSRSNTPSLNSYNHYLRAKLKSGASVGDLMAIIEQMIELKIKPTTESYNVVLEAMFESKDITGVEKLVTRMEKAKESMLDDESYTLVVRLFLAVELIDDAFIHMYVAMISGCMVSMPVFTECVTFAIRLKRFGLLTTILQEYMTLDERKAPCLPWGMCTFILKASLKEDYTRLASCLLEYLEHKCNSQELISQKKVPSAESYLVKIYAYSLSKEFEKAFATLKELECAYGDSGENLFCPFTSLSPLVIALSKGGVGTLDSVHYLLENLGKAEPPYKSVAALNCIILGYAYVHDVRRAYQTFEAIDRVFGLKPDTNSSKALMHAFEIVETTFAAISSEFGLTPDDCLRRAHMHAVGGPKTVNSLRVPKLSWRSVSGVITKRGRRHATEGANPSHDYIC